jgi:ABC-2 type transport system permease protein
MVKRKFNMNVSVVRIELTMLMRSPALVGLVLVFMIAALFAVQTGVARIDARNQDALKAHADASEIRAEKKAAYAEIVANDSPMPSFGIVNYIQTHAFLPPGPLEVLATGHGSMAPTHAALSLWKRKDTLFQHHEMDSPLYLREGGTDFVFLIVVLMPVFIIAVTYQVLAEERDSGRLAVLRVHCGDLWNLAVTRVLLRGGLVVLFTVMLLAVALLYVGATIGLGPGTATALLLWGLLIGAYGLFWMMVSLVVNTLHVRAQSGALILGAVWMATVLVVPAVLSAVADLVWPMPSPLAHKVLARSLENDIRAQGEDPLARYLEAHPDLAGEGPVTFDTFFKGYYTVHRTIEAELMPHLEDYRATRARRQHGLRWLTLASPPALMHQALASAAGTDGGRAAAFRDQVYAFDDVWRDALAPTALGATRIPPEALDRLPEFAFVERTVGAQWARCFPAVVILLLLSAGLYALAHARRRVALAVVSVNE